MGVGNASSASGRPSWGFLHSKEVRLISRTCGCGQPRWMLLSFWNNRWLHLASPTLSRLSTCFSTFYPHCDYSTQVKSHVTLAGNVAICFPSPLRKELV